MTTPLVTRTAAGQLATYDGLTLGWLIVDDNGRASASRAAVHVEDVTDDEIDPGDAPGYDRGVMDVVFEQIEDAGTLKRDPLFTVPSTDLTGAAAVGGVWFYEVIGSDATDELIAFLPYPVGAGSADWDIDPVDGIATVYALEPS